MGRQKRKRLKAVLYLTENESLGAGDALFPHHMNHSFTSMENCVWIDKPLSLLPQEVRALGKTIKGWKRLTGTLLIGTRKQHLLFSGGSFYCTAYQCPALWSLRFL